MPFSVDAVDIKKRIESCKNLQEVEGIRLEYLGKKGLIPSEMKLLGKLICLLFEKVCWINHCRLFKVKIKSKA